MRKETESKIQSESYVWFINNFGLKHHNPRMTMFSVPNEVAMMIRGVLMDTRLPKSKVDQIIAILSQRMKNMGLRSGVSDTVVQLPGKTIFVEFKTPIGVQSDSQKEFQEITEGLGNDYYIVKSVEEFKRVILSQLQDTSTFHLTK